MFSFNLISLAGSDSKSIGLCCSDDSLLVMCSNDSSCLGNVTGCNSRPAFSTAMRTAATTNSVASSFGPMTMGWRPFSGDRCVSEICCISEDDCLFGMGCPTIWLFGLEHAYMVSVTGEFDADLWYFHALWVHDIFLTQINTKTRIYCNFCNI